MTFCYFFNPFFSSVSDEEQEANQSAVEKAVENLDRSLNFSEKEGEKSSPKQSEKPEHIEKSIEKSQQVSKKSNRKPRIHGVTQGHGSAATIIESYKCPYENCGKDDFSTFLELDEHFRSNHDLIAYAKFRREPNDQVKMTQNCSDCGFRFPSQEEYFQHFVFCVDFSLDQGGRRKRRSVRAIGSMAENAPKIIEKPQKSALSKKIKASRQKTDEEDYDENEEAPSESESEPESDKETFEPPPKRQRRKRSSASSGQVLAAIENGACKIF